MSIMTFGRVVAPLRPALRRGIPPLRPSLGRGFATLSRATPRYTVDYWREKFGPARIIGAGPLDATGRPAYSMVSPTVDLPGHVAISSEGRQVLSAYTRDPTRLGEPPLRSYRTIDELLDDYAAGRVSGTDLAANASRFVDASPAVRGERLSALRGPLGLDLRLGRPARSVALSPEHYDLDALPDAITRVAGEVDTYAIPPTTPAETHCVDVTARALNAVRKPGVPSLPDMRNSHPSRLVDELDRIQSAPPQSRALVPLEDAPGRALMPVGGDAGASGVAADAGASGVAAVGDAVTLGDVVEGVFALLVL